MRCAHLQTVTPLAPRSKGCEECLRDGTQWVHLRLCLSCGHVGCCDNSPGRHATKHFQHTGDPVIASWERGERWAWCYPDETDVDLPKSAEPFLR